MDPSGQRRSSVQVDPIAVKDKGDGKKSMTLRIGSAFDGFHPITATQNALKQLYTPAPKPAPAADKEPAKAEDRGFLESAKDWWDSLGKDDDAKKPAASPSGWAIEGKTNKDVTGDYKSLVADAKAGKNTLPPDAQDYIYLNVPGLFTEHYPGYFEENDARMKSLGLDSRTVEIDTDASVDTNAKVIRDAIMEIEATNPGKQVVLTGHSKGGVDIAAALALYPELEPHVRAVVSMQAPYGGTPIATDLAANPKLIDIVSTAIRGLLRGDPKALTDLTYQARQAFVAEHPYPEQIPTVSLATSGGPAVSATAPAAMYMKKKYDLESDGLVPQEDAIIPGSDVVSLDNMDHAGSAMRAPFRGKQDAPGDVTQALLTLALRKATAMEEAEAEGVCR